MCSFLFDLKVQCADITARLRGAGASVCFAAASEQTLLVAVLRAEAAVEAGEDGRPAPGGLRVDLEAIWIICVEILPR